MDEEGRYLFENWNQLSVSYSSEIKGAGRLFADDFLEMLSGLEVSPPCGRILDWCCGPGFIGYALMAYGFGTSLCLADGYGPAIEAATNTAQANNMDRLVTIYNSRDISTLPEHEKFDLVAANPPYFPNRVMLEEIHKDDSKADPRIYVDPDWMFHKQFFSNIRKHLTQNGRIALLENTDASHLETFRPMIETAGLVISGWRWATICRTDMWYLFVSRDDATEPFPIDVPDTVFGR